MFPMLQALQEIEEAQLIEQSIAAQKQQVLTEAKSLPFHIVLVKALAMSRCLSFGSRFYEGYIEESAGYVLGFKDYLEMLVNNAYPPYGQGPYAHGHEAFTLQQILQTISEQVRAAQYISIEDKLAIYGALTTIISRSAEPSANIATTSTWKLARGGQGRPS